jgi:predicted ArsR family transcriptional regulator
MVDWWSETEQAILECLRRDGGTSPGELARRLRISEGETTMFLCMLTREGKVRLRLVESADGRPSSAPLPGGESDSEAMLPVEVGSGWA